MTHDELENLIYERTRCFVDGSVADCILELIAAEREACAKACEEQANGHKALEHDAALTYLSAALDCAEAIRERGVT